ATSGFQNVEALGLPFQVTHSRQTVICCEKAAAVDACTQSIPPVPEQPCAAMIAEAVREIIGPQRMESLAPDRPLMEAGLDSMELLELRMLLSQKFAVELDAPFLFQHNTLQKVGAFFQDHSQAGQKHHPSRSTHETAQAQTAALQTPSPQEQRCRQN